MFFEIFFFTQQESSLRSCYAQQKGSIHYPRKCSFFRISTQCAPPLLVLHHNCFFFLSFFRKYSYNYLLHQNVHFFKFFDQINDIAEAHL